MYRYLFGPVPSRRLGISLGIDLVPMKTCTLNCIYCECGRTTHLTTARKAYVPLKAVQAEFALYSHQRPHPDYVTFSGSGEPTLHAGIGDMVRFIALKTPDTQVAVLTNGTLLGNRLVAEAVMGAAVVIPSLDAATEPVFRAINRPHRALHIENIIAGLSEFRNGYSGQIWLEVFIVPGLNDTEAELAALKQAIEKIAPDQVQLNTLDRPGTVPEIRAATRQELERILHFWQLDNASIIASPPQRKTLSSYREDVETAILETIARRPCTLDDLKNILGLHINEINKYLGVLQEGRKIKSTKQKRGFFYQIP